MPRYFFNVRHGRMLPDTDGVMLDGVADAKRTAIRIISQLLHRQQSSWRGDEWNVEVTDGRDRTYFAIEVRATDAGGDPRPHIPSPSPEPK